MNGRQLRHGDAYRDVLKLGTGKMDELLSDTGIPKPRDIPAQIDNLVQTRCPGDGECKRLVNPGRLREQATLNGQEGDNL